MDSLAIRNRYADVRADRPQARPAPSARTGATPHAKPAVPADAVARPRVLAEVADDDYWDNVPV
jgi:hypothetical protein